MPQTLRIVSGGQTGADRAALDAAMALGLSCGGWCPHGRRAEDGVLPARYPLQETPLADYAQRTSWNVRDSDGTLLLAWGPLNGGTGETLAQAQRLGRPVLTLDPRTADVAALRAWMAAHAIGTLNVAGPRESKAPGIYAAGRAFLERALRPERSGGPGVRMTGQPTVYFDGVCGLCNRFVDLLLRADRHARFRLAPLQGETARVRLSADEVRDLPSIVLEDDTGRYRASDAVLRILARLGGVWWIMSWLRILPRPVREGVYRVVADHRYQWFGKRDTCRLPTASERARFLP